MKPKAEQPRAECVQETNAPPPLACGVVRLSQRLLKALSFATCSLRSEH
jgi:hypothetical protein